MTNDEWTRTLRAGLGAGIALALEHLALYDPAAWREEPEITLFMSNVLGVGTLETARAIVAIREQRYDDAARSAVMVVEAGVVVVVIRLVRRALRLYAENHHTAGHAAGQLDGVAIYDRAFRRPAA